MPSLLDQYLPLAVLMAVAAAILGLAFFLVAFKAPAPEKLSAYERKLNINGFNVVITTSDDPSKAKMTINGKDIPLVYSAAFKGWNVPHTTFSFFPDLEALAANMVYGNSDLIIGHGINADNKQLDTGMDLDMGSGIDSGTDSGMDSGMGTGRKPAHH